jgi:lipoprotein-anchoring transpeptidase ErfK/SrfK
MLLNYVNIWGKILIIPVLFFSLMIVYDSAESNKAFSSDMTNDSIINNQQVYPEITPIRYRENVIDTVYTIKDTIIEVSLIDQMVYIRQRSGKVDTILCSSGTPYLEKGQATQPGIFIVRTRLPELISKQFNDTKCLNWVGFSYGIGFHSLISKGYYWSLGKRPSSHGCIRLSQDGSKKLYDNVELGTPVIVHRNNLARTIAFLPKGYPVDTSFTRKEVSDILKEKLNTLYAGQIHTDFDPHIIVHEKYVGHSGFDVGERERVPNLQKVIVRFYQTNSFTEMPDRTLAYHDIEKFKDLFDKDSTNISKE